VSNLPGLGDTVTVGTYDCNNVYHRQFQPIQSYSIVVNFYICEHYNPQCKAGFVMELDSSSAQPRKYRFIDLSSGNPDRWQWDFGDGTTSEERNPVHTYATPGHYSACLTISREHLYQPCSDSVCSSFTTPFYHGVGGHVFAGLQPINNPFATGDTGIAYIYRFIDNRIRALDTLNFTYLGYYSFPQLLSGEYMIKVALTPGSVNARRYAPAYFPQSLYWIQSGIPNLNDTSLFDLDIHLIPLSDTASGPAKISGRVEWEKQSSGFFTLDRSEVLLLDSLKRPVAYTLSDAAGEFSFPSVKYGNYYAYVESAGKFSRYTLVTVSPAAPFVDTLVLKIYDQNIIGIAEPNAESFHVDPPFPNPSNGKIITEVHSDKTAKVRFEIYSLQGRLLIETRQETGPGNTEIITDISQLPAGLYLMFIRSEQQKLPSVFKIVKL
jgi:hypothetical protein